MSSVGIIANPRAGKDIRRLVAHAPVLDTQEKIYTVRRALLGLEGAAVAEVLLMPDSSEIGERALGGISGGLDLRASFVDMFVRDDASDSERAASLMHERGARCIIVVGGDGTNRAVAKGCGPTPVVPLSTGTNNTFPRALEPTVAGLAAGLYAVRGLAWHEFTLPTKRLDLFRNGTLEEVALVDVAVCDDRFVGARALWEVERVREIFLTQGTATSVGLAAVGAMVRPVSPRERGGLHLALGDGGMRVRAAVAPGLIRWVAVRSHGPMAEGVPIPVSLERCVLALDGERELAVGAREAWTVTLGWEGPRLLDVEKVLDATRAVPD